MNGRETRPDRRQGVPARPIIVELDEFEDAGRAARERDASAWREVAIIVAILAVGVVSGVIALLELLRQA